MRIHLYIFFFLVQDSAKAKPATIGLSIRKDIFMSPKKEVIELGVSKVDYVTENLSMGLNGQKDHNNYSLIFELGISKAMSDLQNL